jgi:hypothetical protein
MGAAYAIGEKLTRRLIRHLQTLPPGLLAAEGAANLWDEICVQARRESPLCEAYNAEMATRLGALVTKLPEVDRQLMWLITDAGQRALPERESVALNPGQITTRDHDTVRYVISEHVAYEVWNYENGRIRKMTDL